MACKSRDESKCVASCRGVTACQALLDEAVAWQADMVLVHHGYFWKNEPVAITGMKQRRIKNVAGQRYQLAGLPFAA